GEDVRGDDSAERALGGSPEFWKAHRPLRRAVGRRAELPGGGAGIDPPRGAHRRGGPCPARRRAAGGARMTDTAAGRRRLGRGLVGNLQRDDLSPVDEARGYERLIQEFSLTQQDVAAAVGRDRSTVANALRLLRLPDAVLTMIHEGHLSVGHARALLALEDLRQVTILARDAVAQGWSVREVEDRVRGGRAPERRQ